MSERQNSTALVIEVDPNRISGEERDHANDLCYGVNGKYYRIITFGLESLGIEEVIQSQGLLRARISYIVGIPNSPNDGKHYQVEEILPEETVID